MEGAIPGGTQIGSYVVDTVLGRGGMGVVYRAYHPRLQRWAAIKVLPPLTTLADARERFEREAQAVARLRHRHILSVFDFGEFQGQPYMVIEYMPNGSMQERMPPAAVTVPQAVAVLRPLAEALDYAHAHGVLHRDVKPANVFLDNELHPVLADFGLAKLYSDESATSSGIVSGTPTHMSPEQANGSPVSPSTDLYSLGVIAYQLVSGRLPFAGALMEVLYAQVNLAPPAPSSVNPALRPEVDAVILKALAKRPQDRWRSCVEFVSALEAASAGRVDERAAPRPAPAVEVPIAPVTPAELPATPPRPAARRPAPALLAAVAAVIVIALATTAYLSGLFPPGAAAKTPPSQPAAGSPAATPVPRSLTVSPPSPLTIGEAIQISGKGLDPSRPAGAGIYQGGKIHAVSSQLNNLSVAADGSFTGSGFVSSDLAPGAATLLACNDPGPSTDPSRCIQLPVQLQR
jgi:hypothetical protein